MMPNSNSIIIQSAFIILCLASIFVHTSLLTDPYIVPKWLLVLSILLGMAIYSSIRTLLGGSVRMNMSLIGISIVIICSLQALCGLLQYINLFPSNNVSGLTGSFDNPAGFAATLSVGFSFVGLLIRKGSRLCVQCLGWIAAIIFLIAVILSESRAGIVSMIVVSAIFLYSRFIRKPIWKYLLLGAMIPIIIGCYWMKKDSADGRLLIWQCGINMVKDSPWVGHGIGSFEARYMDYQAKYFETRGQQNRYAMLADNVKQPFNEYLGVLLNFGIIGLLVLAMVVVLLIHGYKRNTTYEKRIALCALISIGTFSLFSYPFTYPFTWIITFLSIFIIAREYINEFFGVAWRKNTICVMTLGCSMVGVYNLVERVQAELEWGKTSKLALCGSYDKALPSYEKQMETFTDNPYFLYNYAAVLQEMKQYEKSLEVALQCRQYWADYDLELMIGENYQRLNEMEKAETYYNRAAMMCPSRFMPLYKLFHLYKDNEVNPKMIEMAESILNKPMKIKTSSIVMMKREVERTLR